MNHNDIPPMTAEMAENIIARAQAMFEVQIRQAILAEREACAKLCDDDSNMWVDHHECATAIRARDGEPETYCHTYYHIETGACIQHGEWARTAGLGCPACNGEIEKYKE
jgi:predicted  nucleic acid-binding Zn ribbon protein